MARLLKPSDNVVCMGLSSSNAHDGFLRSITIPLKQVQSVILACIRIVRRASVRADVTIGRAVVRGMTKDGMVDAMS